MLVVKDNKTFHFRNKFIGSYYGSLLEVWNQVFHFKSLAQFFQNLRPSFIYTGPLLTAADTILNTM